MRKWISLISVSIMTLAFSAHADVSGVWMGKATWNYDGSLLPCLFKVQYHETETEIYRHKGELACDMLTMHSDPLTWVKQGQGLTLNGELAGSWSESGFETKELAEDNVKVITNLNIVTGEYKEVWSKIDDQTTIYIIEGTLKRQE